MCSASAAAGFRELELSPHGLGKQMQEGKSWVTPNPAPELGEGSVGCSPSLQGARCQPALPGAGTGRGDHRQGQLQQMPWLLLGPAAACPAAPAMSSLSAPGAGVQRILHPSGHAHCQNK